MKAERSWQVSTVDGRAEEWLPLVTLSGVALGVSRGGTWLVGNHDGCIPVSSPSAGVRLLALLEKEPLPTKLEIDELISAHEIPVDRGAELPILVAVMQALRGPMSYW